MVLHLEERQDRSRGFDAAGDPHSGSAMLSCSLQLHDALAGRRIGTHHGECDELLSAEYVRATGRVWVGAFCVELLTRAEGGV